MKKILGLTLAALMVMGLVGGGTWAYFSDTESSTGNTFTAGTLDLKLTDVDEPDADGVIASWSNGNVAPGDSVLGWVDLKNSGSLTANHVEISFTNTVTNVITPPEIEAVDDTDISDSMIVTAMSYGAIDFLAQTVPGTFDRDEIRAADEAGINDGILTLDELDGVTIDDLTEVPAANGVDLKRFAMTVQLDTLTGNGNQGDGVTTVINFVINQNATQ